VSGTDLDPRRQKESLRGELAARRAALGAEQRASASRRVAERLFASSELLAARSVFTCLSFGDELDTWGIVARLLESGREVYVPRAERSPTRLAVCRFPCALVTLSFGLRQPPTSEPELPEREIDATIDLALVAGLGFDRRGYRLGYGSGYFDRFLAGRPFPALGLAFDTQIVDRLPVEPHDMPMAALITESERMNPAESA